MGGSKGGRGGSGSGSAGGNKEKKKTTSARRTGGVQTANKPFVGFSAFAVTPEPEVTPSRSPATSAVVPGVGGGGGGSGGGGGVARPSPVYAGSNRRLTALFQKLRKKDPVTKTKALESLRRYAFPTASDAASTAASSSTSENESGEGADGPIEGEEEEEKLIKYDVILALNHFAFLFHNPHTPPSTCLALDNDHRVRAGALGCWTGAVRTVPRAARSLLLHGSRAGGGGTNILGAIWCLRSDPVREVSASAASAVRAIVTDGGDCPLPMTMIVDSAAAGGGGGKDGENSVLVRDAVVSHLNSTLPSTRRRSSGGKGRGGGGGDGAGRGASGGVGKVKSKKGGKDDVGGGGGDGGGEGDDGEEEERYERTIVSALDGASKLMARFPEDTTRREGGDDGDGRTENEEIGFTYGRAFAEGVPWKHVASQRGSFRRGTYNLVSSASQHAPSILSDHPSIRTSLVNAFSSERDPTNFPPLFEALLMYLSAASAGVTEADGGITEEWYHRVCGALGKQLRRACCGSPAARWCPLVLPLLARLPATEVEEGGKGEESSATSEAVEVSTSGAGDGVVDVVAGDSATRFRLRLHRQVLTSLWEGREAAVSTLDQIAIATAVSEGAAFLLLRRRTETALSKRGTAGSLECNQGVKEADDWLGDEVAARASIDLFIATLRWYMEENAVVPPLAVASGRGNNVVDLVARQARELHRIDEAWQSKAKQDCLLLKYGEHFWVKLGGVPGFGIGDANDKSAETQLGEPHVKKLLFLLQGIIDQSQPQKEGELALWRETDEALFKVAAAKEESSLVSCLGRNFRFILDACKSRDVSLPTRNELHLLATLVAFCGVFRLFFDDVEASRAAVSTASRTADGGGVVVADKTAASVENFCMNDLLRWTVILGSSNNPNVSNVDDSRDSMIRLCFVLLRQCLEVLTTRRQKQLWEAFLRELIEARCHLGVLAIGLSVLSSPVRQSEQSPLDDIIRCGTLEKLAVEVGIAAEDLRRAALEELDVPPSVIEIDHHEGRESFAQYESELSSFLQVCAGLASATSNILVGPNVIRKWMASCINLNNNVQTRQQGANDGLLAGNNMLLETLVALVLEKRTTMDEVDLVSLAMEGWRRGGTVWIQECHALLLGSTWTTSDEPNTGKDGSAAIRERFCAAASDSLKNDLCPTQNWPIHDGFMNVASRQWAHRAQRLVTLNETISIQNQQRHADCSSGSPSRSRANPLSCIGLGDEQTWKDVRSNSTTNDGIRHGTVWIWSCLKSFLDMVGDEDGRMAILLGNRTKQDAALFVEILLSSTMVSQLPSNKSEAGRELIAAVGGKERLGDEFVFVCCEVVVEFVLDAMKQFLHEDDMDKSADACYSQATKFEAVGSGVRILDLLVSCALTTENRTANTHANDRQTSSGNRLLTEEKHGGDSVEPSEVKEGDTLWYVADENEENSLGKRVTVVKVHTDDYPNLYFTIVENGSNRERQTVSSRLRKHDMLLHSVKVNKASSEDIVGGIDLSAEQSKWAVRLENLVVNNLVKPFFDFLSSVPPNLAESCIQHFVEAACETLNIVISRCQLAGGVGVGSVRYEVFQLVKSIEEQLVRTVKARSFRSIRCKSSGRDKIANATEDDEKRKAPEQRICCETAFVCFSLAMAGGRYTEPSSRNFYVLRYDPCDSISAVFDLYEDTAWFNSHPPTKTCNVLDIHTASLMWSAAVAGSLHDEPSLVRLACTMNEIIRLVLASVKQTHGDLQRNMERTLLVMRAVCALHDQQNTLDEFASNLSLPSLSELVWCLVHLWNDGGLNRCDNKQDTPPWHDPFLTVLQSVDEREVLLHGARKHVDDICGTLFCPRKRWFGYQLLNMIASAGFTQETQLSPPIQAHLDSWVKSIPLEEAEELKEDVEIACRFVPRALLEALCTCSGGSTKEEDTVVSETDGADACMGKLLSWLSILDFLEKSASADARSRGAVISYIQQTNGGRLVLDIALQCSPLVESRGKSATNGTRWLPCTDFEGRTSDLTLPNVSMLVIFRTVQALPTLVKSWWNDYCHKTAQSAFKQFVQNEVGTETLRIELERIKSAHVLGDMIVSGSCVSREVMATYIQDECKLSVLIRVPDSFPLRNVEVDCHKTLGVPEKRWRRWALQIMMMLNNQDGSILDALMLWKENVDKEFDGVEPCPVCYSVLCVKTHAMPNLECKTCNNRFHVSCLYKWFHSSGKSQCVLCQQPWSGTRV